MIVITDAVPMPIPKELFNRPPPKLDDEGYPLPPPFAIQCHSGPGMPGGYKLICIDDPKIVVSNQNGLIRVEVAPLGGVAAVYEDPDCTFVLEKRAYREPNPKRVGTVLGPVVFDMTHITTDDIIAVLYGGHVSSVESDATIPDDVNPRGYEVEGWTLPRVNAREMAGYDIKLLLKHVSEEDMPLHEALSNLGATERKPIETVFLYMWANDVDTYQLNGATLKHPWSVRLRFSAAGADAFIAALKAAYQLTTVRQAKQIVTVIGSRDKLYVGFMPEDSTRPPPTPEEIEAMKRDMTKMFR